MKIETTIRKLSYHTSYKDLVPCILIGNKKYAEKYNWKVGDQLIIRECPNGLYMAKYEKRK